MFRTDKAKRFCIPLWFTIFIMLLIVGESKAQTSWMACNNQVNISMDEDCTVTVTPDMILVGESSYPPPYDDLSNFEITISPSTGSGTATELIITEPGIYSVTITETVSGYDNNCWGTLLVEDKLPPTILDCPCPVGNTNPDCTLKATCAEMEETLDGHDDVLVPSYTDCSTTYLGYYDEMVDEGPCYATKIHRTYVVTDEFGNKATSCVMEYTVDPINLYTDILDPHSPVELPCTSGYSTTDIFNHYYQVKLDELLALATTDEEEEEAYHLATVYGNKYAYPSINGNPINATVCNLAVTKSDLVVPACDACPDIKKVIRKWTYLDWCTGASHEFTQLIVNGSTDGPTITANNVTASVDPWDCTASILMPHPEHINDSCSDAVTYDITGPFGVVITQTDNGYYHVANAPKGQHTFYYNAYDCCGNSNSTPVIVTVVDATPPVAIATENIVVSLTTAVGGTGIAKLFAESVDKGSHDGCGAVKLEIRREEQNCDLVGNTTYNNDDHSFDDEDDLDDGEFVKFCCADLDANGVDEDGDGVIDYSQYKVWLRVWDDGDMDGVYGSDGDHYNEAWSWVRLENKVPPSLLCPADITVDCEVDIHDLTIVGGGQGASACGSAQVDYVDENQDGGTCAYGVIHRKWFITGNPDAYCVQVITRLGPDYSTDVHITFPKDTIIDCMTDNMEVPYWIAPACNELAFSVDSDTFYFTEGACLKIRNEWTVIDWCTYEPNDEDPIGIWEHTQIIKVIDETAPDLASCDALMFEADDSSDADGDGVTCENNAVMLTQTADDSGACGSNRINWTIQVDLWSDWEYDYTFRSTVPPGHPDYIAPTATGEEVKVTLPDGIPGSMSNHRVKWTATDGCGNVVSCTQDFMVVDKKSPTPYCVNVSSALMDDGEIELWACDFDLGSFDNCSSNEDLRFTFSDVIPSNDPSYNAASKCSARTFTCDDALDDAGQTSPVEVTVYVWDEKDNFDFCTVYLTLVDNNGVCGDSLLNTRIGGQIVSESGEELTQISVELMSSMPEYPLFDNTNENGEFSFYNIPMYLNYEISSIKNDDALNGVSTLDVLIIQQHILSIAELDSPYKMIAADANNDSKISGVDLIQIRKLILGIYEDFPHNTSWRFPIKDQIMTSDNPWPFTEVINISSISTPMMDNDFIGVKIGDVNNTAITNLVGNIDTESRSSEKVELYYEDIISNIETVSVPVKISKDMLINGMQFTIEHPGAKLLRIDSGSIEIDENNYAAGIASTTFSWSKANASTFYEGEVLFLLVFEGDKIETINASSAKINSEAYVGENLETVNLTLGQNTDTFVNELYQNSPNPFSGNTNIGFSLAQDSQVKLKFFDISGKMIKTLTGNYKAGANQLNIDAKELESSGVLYYQLEAEGFTATRKMIIIK